MTTLREAAQQALEALEQIAVLAEYGTTGPGKCHSRALNEQQATALRLSVSDLSRSQITALRAALAEPVQKPVANDDEVICPACCHQFRAIPPNVQQMMLDAGFEPPFTAPPQRKPLTDEEIADMWVGILYDSPPSGVHEDGLVPHRLARAIERAHGIGGNT